jgi:hypothetical protein
VFDFSKRINSQFPEVYDTRVLYENFQQGSDNRAPARNLKEVCGSLMESNAGPFEVETSVPIGTSSSAHHVYKPFEIENMSHDAGYDALMTAVIYLRLSKLKNTTSQSDPYGFRGLINRIRLSKTHPSILNLTDVRC